MSESVKWLPGPEFARDFFWESGRGCVIIHRPSDLHPPCLPKEINRC
jgi:hypothetical protein